MDIDFGLKSIYTFRKQVLTTAYINITKLLITIKSIDKLIYKYFTLVRVFSRLNSHKKCLKIIYCISI